MTREYGAGASKRKRRLWHVVAGIFLLLLLISHIVRRANNAVIDLRPDQSSVQLRAVEGDSVLEETVTMAYTLIEPDTLAYPDPPVLILLHGSPVASLSMMPLAVALPDSFVKVIPDLPGFGRSTTDIPDYSVEAGAVYMNQMMDSLGIEKAHLLAYSMSGGVAIQQYDKAPEKVESIVMLSAIGVQELELLGSYTLNHAVHGVQLAVIWGIQEFIPHMGYMDNGILNTSYARNFFDTDQRPLRGILERYEPPMLIMHGESDMLVPVEAAIEHARIVPQSVLALFEGGHGLVFKPDTAFLESLSRFVYSVENGTAQTRESASIERLQRASQPFDKSMVPEAEGLKLLVYMLLIALATLISEDATCIGAGLLVAQGTIDFFPATLACLLGIVFGDCFLFFAGRFISGPLLRRAPFRWFLREEALEDASQWVRKRGPLVIIASRFVPGSRVPTYVAAGSLGLPFWKFLLYFLTASTIWTPILVGFSVAFGERLLSRFLSIYETYAIWAFLGMILLILGVTKVVVPLFSHQGRRMLVGWWRRKTEWEFWPLWLFYLPIVFYVLYLGIRYRSITLFTGANPGIDMGGFIGESKAEILGKLSGATDRVASFVASSPADSIQTRVEEILAFKAERGLAFPLILKPNVGERGKGVVKVCNREDIEEYLSRHRETVIAQEYAAGREYGIFYYRYPEETHGHIFSITDKRFPRVVGDGKRTLRRLILDDRRAVCMAGHYFEANHHHLFDIPPAGDTVQLVDIGTHCRGAIFLDGESIRSPALEKVVDTISKGVDGFYFGRFDIRTPSIDDFKEGKNFKIVELNGVTSEATHIYDPANSLSDAYRILRKQWRIAFEIGAQNRDRGLRPASIKEVVKRLWAVAG